MKFLIDADLPYSLKEIFAGRGCEALHVRDVGLFSAADEEIFDYASKNNFIILTRDLGFADIVLERKTASLVIARLPNYFTREKINKIFNDFLKSVDAKDFSKSIIVVEIERYRIRKIE